MVYPTCEVIHKREPINMTLVNAYKNVTELLLIWVLAENAFLVYSSYLGVEGEFKRLIDRQYLVLGWIYIFQKKEEVYVYGKGHTP